MAALTNEEMIKYVKSQGNKVVSLNDENYEHILNGERDYHLIVMLSSQSAKINCALCNEFKPEFEIVGNSWIQDHPNGLSKEELEDTESLIPKKNVYFMFSEFTESRNFFLSLQLNNIPKVFHFPPSTSKRPNEYIKQFDEYQFYQGDHKSLLASWLNQITGHTFNIYIPPDYTRIATNALITFALVMLIRRFSAQFTMVVTSKILWSGISLVAILLLISGYMFNQIRGVPFVMEHQSGKVDYFVPQQQNQLGVETQIMSFIYGCLSLLVVMLIKKAPEIKNSHVKLIAVIVLSILIFVLYSILLSIFGIKGMGYPYRFITL
ncbi:uncharacterized protein AC631_04075 [Debaryomyces fabryi]|uniref:Dolichyl-diphosphooligosaccharide--protein glycosyltransferase subunit 3 n=1 Tax=Debaryomyces fabryi TaxID=58627 RepID=A0A0V1PV84_9ASCO|nr:uncharacterized protein AC631_04075 [Debaryomyces fabryi]KSA00158.1 hypothetical protein AC631_04075 [Debaryomyces fabryi]